MNQTDCHCSIFLGLLYSQSSITVSSNLLSCNIIYLHIYIYIFPLFLCHPILNKKNDSFLGGRISIPIPSARKKKVASETSIGVTMADGGWRCSKNWIIWKNADFNEKTCLLNWIFQFTNMVVSCNFALLNPYTDQYNWSTEPISASGLKPPHFSKILRQSVSRNRMCGSEPINGRMSLGWRVHVCRYIPSKVRKNRFSLICIQFTQETYIYIYIHL